LDPGRDAAAVARVLATDALCAECIARRTGVDVDAVLEAVGALEAQVRVHRTWGRCPVCAGTGRTVLRLDEGSRSRGSAAYDADPRHSGVRCGKCWKPIGVGGQRVILRHGQPYHTACLEGPSRVRESSSEARTDVVSLIPGAESALVCTCTH